MTIELRDALELIRDGKARYSGTTHTDKFGFAAVIDRLDRRTVDHVSDVGSQDVFALLAANDGYRVQFSAHGAGRESVQVFDGEGQLVRDYDHDGDWDWGALKLAPAVA